MPQLFDRHFLLAIVVSTGSILVLINGALGSNGHSIVTGSFLLLSTAALALCGQWRFSLNLIDVFFFAFVGCVGVTFALNGMALTKEAGLLALSLAAYPACRFLPIGRLRPSFALVTGIIVAVGSIVTASALYAQWNDHHGKPFVLGFDHAPTVFLTSLGFLLIAVVTTTKLNHRSTVWISGIIFLPCAIFAASMVRFMFISIVLSLAVAIVTSSRSQRIYILIISGVLAFSVLVGLAARHRTTQTFVSFAASSRASCDEGDNSIAIRKQLFLDGLGAVPSSGFFGTGLGSFQKISCVPNASPHNSPLQAFIEFGWLGGIAFVLLLIAAYWRLWPIAGVDLEARFVFCCLTYVTLATLAHGNISRDALLFLFLGYSASVINGLAKASP
jgi:hypothetical protein